MTNSSGMLENPDGKRIEIPDFGNFRDCGGHRSDLGGLVKQGLLFRSGTLTQTDSCTRDKLLAMDFHLVADLRYDSERSEEISPWPETYRQRILVLEGGAPAEAPHVAVMKSGAFDEPAVERFYVHYYQTMVDDPAYQKLFARFLNALVKTTGRALFHCSAGKDRTGVLAALINRVLGVRDELILADYMRSNQQQNIETMAETIEWRLRRRSVSPTSRRVVIKMLEVEEIYLNAALQRIDSEWGSTRNYLEKIGFGLDGQELLRHRFLDSSSC